VDYDANKTIEDAESLSPRAYEVPASGGFLISEWRAEIDDIFDGCVPTFKTPQELDALIHYYLDPANELERVELSDMQREAVTKAHSYCDRARELLRKVNAV
jgi:spore maturation protein CgeB